MQENPTPVQREGDPVGRVAEQDDVDDGVVLAILVDCDQPGLWSVDEVIRAVGNRVGAADSLMRLERDGLIHRLEGFVFPTRAAVRGSELRV